MNTEAMTRLADFIEDVEPEAFSMDYYWADSDVGTICGTAGCLAGWQAHIGRHAEAVIKLEHEGCLPNYFQLGKIDLGLNEFEANNLFTNPGWWAKTFVTLGLRDEDWYDKSVPREGLGYTIERAFGLHDITNKEASLVLRGIVDGTVKP